MTKDAAKSLTLGTAATLACIWEATAPKPGNVYRGADFEDVTYVDFLTSAAVIGPVIERAPKLGIGKTVLEAVKATSQAVGTNTNLGTILLLAPLAMTRGSENWSEAATESIKQVSPQETELVFEAIRLAEPGGLGSVPQADVHSSAEPIPLWDAMQLAQERDLVARQYVNGFAQVWEAAYLIATAYNIGSCLADSIVDTHIQLLSRYPDSLIARKCGIEIAKEAKQFAEAVWKRKDAGREAYGDALADFDFWLRSDAHRRNPGTTADLIAAGLFVGIIEERLTLPIRFYDP